MKRHRLSLDVPEPVRKLLERLAARESRSFTEIIRRALEAYDNRGRSSN